ncbi:PREDICTED: uncharacterized protein LOC109593232, partial [Amphimedon queenslandica]|uniref:Uncharacterized protein n=1 Tax=Amphimedon queenslandica TaxID=400682 RepID=A0AAN0K464_AMPQE
ANFMQLKKSLVSRLDTLKRSSSESHVTSYPSPVHTLFDKDIVTMGTDQLSCLLQNIMASPSVFGWKGANTGREKCSTGAYSWCYTLFLCLYSLHSVITIN